MHARPLPARAGLSWLREAFQLYRKNAPLLTSAAMFYVLLTLVVGLLPVIGTFLLSLIQPMFIVLLANVCAMTTRGEAPTQTAMAYKLIERRPALIQLGLLHMCLGVALVLLAFLLAYLLGAPTDPDEFTAGNIYTLLLPVLLVMVPAILLTWFSPLLTAWHDVPPPKALFFSLIAVWRNLGGFFVFFLSVTLFFFVLPSFVMELLSVLFPEGREIFFSLCNFLILMTLSPILPASIYSSYRQIFLAPPGEAP